MPKAQWIFDTASNYFVANKHHKFQTIGTSRNRRHSHSYYVHSRISAFNDNRGRIASFTSYYVVYTNGTSNFTDEHVYESMSFRGFMAFITESGSYMVHHGDDKPEIVKLDADLVSIASFDSDGLVGVCLDGSLTLITNKHDNSWQCEPYVWPMKPHPAMETVDGRFYVQISGRKEEVEMKYASAGNKYLFIRSENSPYAQTLGARRAILAKTAKRNRQVLEEIPHNCDSTVVDIAHGFILMEVPYESRDSYDVYDFTPDGKLTRVAGNVYYKASPNRHRKMAI